MWFSSVSSLFLGSEHTHTSEHISECTQCLGTCCAAHNVCMQDAHTVDHKPLKWAVAYFMQSDSMGCGLCGVLGQCQPVTVKRNCQEEKVYIQTKRCNYYYIQTYGSV